MEYFGVLNNRVYFSWYVIDSIDLESAPDSRLNKDSIEVSLGFVSKTMVRHFYKEMRCAYTICIAIYWVAIISKLSKIAQANGEI